MSPLSKTLGLTAVAAAIAIGSAAVPGVATPAEAKKIVIFKKHHHHHHGKLFLGTSLLLAGSGGYYYYGSCYRLKLKAIRSGSDYWWDRYYACKSD